MIYIAQIMRLLGIEQSAAEVVMDNMGIHLSSASTAIFNKVARETYAYLVEAGEFA
jgi:hypothetical protein